ncbi:MAG TPA: C-GCAxxG-C-C family (seleno)protein [Verrucomicrobiae bacterium]|nr:C-GCAxxG-C-C family (seleno)protein [Verrucomicrobiae bacterium]
MSRRNFLVKAGALTAGMAIAGGVLGSSVKEAEAVAISLPIPYSPIDVQAVREAAYNAYSAGGCCYGAAHGLISVLQSQSGANANWSAIDDNVFTYGAGGVNGWGTLCGALNGSLYVMAMALGAANMTAPGNDLLNWYCKFPFPSSTLRTGTSYKAIPTGEVTLDNVYTDTEKRILAAGITSVSGSPLCHASVSTWVKAVNDQYAVTDPKATTLVATSNNNAKKDRCARLTADTAAKAATILNAIKAGTYAATSMATIETNYCMTCHNQSNVPNPGDFPPVSNKNDEQGKMPCVECHTEEAAHSTMMSDENADDCVSCHNL